MTDRPTAILIGGFRCCPVHAPLTRQTARVINPSPKNGSHNPPVTSGIGKSTDRAKPRKWRNPAARSLDSPRFLTRVVRMVAIHRTRRREGPSQRRANATRKPTDGRVVFRQVSSRGYLTTIARKVIVGMGGETDGYERPRRKKSPSSVSDRSASLALSRDE